MSSRRYFFETAAIRLPILMGSSAKESAEKLGRKREKREVQKRKWMKWMATIKDFNALKDLKVSGKMPETRP